MRLFFQTTRRIAPLCNGSPQAALGLHHIKDLILLQLHTPVQVFLDVEGVFLIIVSCVLEVRVLGQVILIREERPHTPKLQDTLASVHDGQLIPAHQFPSILSSDEFRFGQKKYPLHSKPRFQTREYVVIKILTNRNLSESKIAFIAKALRYQSTLVLSSICNLYIQDLFSPIQFASF